MFGCRDANLGQTGGNISAPFPAADMYKRRIAHLGRQAGDEAIGCLLTGQHRPTRFLSQRGGGLANAVARPPVLNQRVGHFHAIAGRKDDPARRAKIERFACRCDLHQRGDANLQPPQIKCPDPRRKGFGRGLGPGQKQHGFDVLRHGAPSIVPNSLR